MLCSHGGKRWIEGAPVDGYDSKTNTVFQFHGCHWNGCHHCFLNSREEIINHGHMRENCFLTMAARTQALREAGYCVIEKWECDMPKTGKALPWIEMKTYSHAILYDFESHSAQKQAVTDVLMYESVHVPISVSITDTLERDPMHICDANKKELIKKFMAGLERHGANI